MSSILISIPKISIYWFRAHKTTIFPGRITILIFMFSMYSESNLRNHLLFAPRTQFGTLFKTLIYLLGASRNFWEFFKFQILKITLSSLSALLWRSVIFLEMIFKKWKTQTSLFLALKNRKFHEKIIIKKITRSKKWIKLRSWFL